MGDPVKRHRIEVIDRTYAAILAAKTPAERVAMIRNCHRFARQVMEAGERMRHPEWDQDRVRQVVSERLANGTG